jgi:transposase-like protein
MSNVIDCPHCGEKFTPSEANQYKEHKIAYILYTHGMSYRSIAKLFNWTSPESAKVRVNVYKKIKGV